MTEIQEFRRPHPFTRCVSDWWEDGELVQKYVRWRPGAWGTEIIPPDDARAFAHAMGECVFTVQGEYKPGRYPTRVFFTQQFVDPDGKPLKASGLKIKTKSAFKRQVDGLPFAFELDPFADPIET